MHLLSQIRHQNLVSLEGFCHESKQQILVYEYLPGGSLADNLYGMLYMDATNFFSLYLCFILIHSCTSSMNSPLFVDIYLIIRITHHLRCKW